MLIIWKNKNKEKRWGEEKGWEWERKEKEGGNVVIVTLGGREGKEREGERLGREGEIKRKEEDSLFPKLDPGPAVDQSLHVL